MRINFVAWIIFILLTAIAARLGYWQILNGDNLARAASLQRSLSRPIPAQRGQILARDGKILVANESGYLLFASTVDLKVKPAEAAGKLAPILSAATAEDQGELSLPKDTILPKIEIKDLEKTLTVKLSQADNYYIPLAHRLKQKYADQIYALGIYGLGFDQEPRRLYPEGSLLATTLGFVGSSATGDPLGYFGLEGFYNGELSGRNGVQHLERDAAGHPILLGDSNTLAPQDGRSITTTIDRFVQLIVEKHLREGVEKYGARKGTAVVMDPKTGGILAAVTWPAFDPRGYQYFSKDFYTDDAVSDTYEPGSTFKVLTMAAGIDSGTVTPDTICAACGAPFEVQGHSIRTWNNQYYPTGETMTKVLEHSNNVGTAWLATKMGKDKFYSYAKAFGVGDKTGIDIEGEESGIFYDPKKIAPIDLATMAFGQGFSTTAVKILQIVGTVANGGKLPQLHIVSKLTDTGVDIPLKIPDPKQVIKPLTASLLTQMMIGAVEHGEAHRLVPPGYRVAGKTGTAQVPVAGHYDAHKTVASFVGFAPAEDPKFVMIVKYVEPTTTPFGATTAVPTFMDITKELFGYFGVAPSTP